MNMACISWPGEGAGGEGAGSQHSFFLIQVLQLSVAEISNILRLSRNERCPPEEYLWHGEASSWQSPDSTEQSQPGKLCKKSTGIGTGHGAHQRAGLERKVCQPPVAAGGKAGFLLEWKIAVSAWRVTCSEAGRFHQRPQKAGPGGRGAGASPAAFARSTAGLAAWGKAARPLPWKTRVFSRGSESGERYKVPGRVGPFTDRANINMLHVVLACEPATELQEAIANSFSSFTYFHITSNDYT